MSLGEGGIHQALAPFRYAGFIMNVNAKFVDIPPYMFVA